jgi:acetyl esterase/lipase
MPVRLITTAIVVGMIMASCSSDADSDGPESEVNITSDLVYMTVDGDTLLMDVYAPSGDGPFPTVVAFHGRSSAMKGSEDTTAVAERAAAQGMVVFVPTWKAGEWFPITVDSVEMTKNTGNCAVAFAQQIATDYDGNPNLMALYGFSAGTGPAQRAALDPSAAPIPGCSTEAIPTPLSGVVLGDGEYFWHSENFDAVFSDHPAAMQDTIATMTDPSRWPADLDTRFHLWSAAEGTAPRALGSPGSDGDWLAARDPSGSIRRDLEELGLLDDGIVSYIDSARLFERRLASAGVDVQFDEYPGGHTSTNKLREIVDALRATMADT